MSKTATAEPDTSLQDETRRQRKKLAKQEAKIMLQIEQIKKETEKAQKKVTRAQLYLDENQAHLHKLEEKLLQIRTTGEPQPGASQGSLDTSSEAQSETEQPTQQVIGALVPATVEPSGDQGHADITVDTSPATAPEELPLTQAESDITSYPVDEQNTPSFEAITETDTTTPEHGTVNGNSTLSLDEAQSLVEHNNEQSELSDTPDTSASEEQTSATKARRRRSPRAKPEVQENEPEENPQA